MAVAHVYLIRQQSKNAFEKEEFAARPGLAMGDLGKILVSVKEILDKAASVGPFTVSSRFDVSAFMFT